MWCEHNHSKQHINYLEGFGDTQYDDGSTGEFNYTLKVEMYVCVHCQFIKHQSIKRVVWVVVPQIGTDIIQTFNNRQDAKDHAIFVKGNWMEAELAGGIGNG